MEILISFPIIRELDASTLITEICNSMNFSSENKLA
jgi:hypothetical protein